MSFSTWSNDDCDQPDWDGIKAAIQSLAQSANAIAVDLQAPAQACCAWIGSVEAKIRRRIDNQSKALIRRLNEAVALIAGPLTQLGQAMVDGVLGTVRFVHSAVLASGSAAPTLPPLLGHLPATATHAGDASILPFELPVEPSPSTVPTKGDVYIPPPESTIHVEPECQPACPPGMVPAPPPADPHDIDQPNLLVIADRTLPWHQALRSYYDGAMDPVLLSATLGNAVLKREQEAQTRLSQGYTELASNLPPW